MVDESTELRSTTIFRRFPTKCVCAAFAPLQDFAHLYNKTSSEQFEIQAEKCLTFFELFATISEIDQDSKKNHNFLALWDSNLSLVQFKIVLSGRILRDGERSPYVRLTLWDILSVFFVVLVGVSSVLI